MVDKSDNELLARLNALKSSSITLDKNFSPDPAPKTSPSSISGDLTSRFRSLTGRDAIAATNTLATETDSPDPDLDAAFADGSGELERKEEWMDWGDDEGRETKKLLKEAGGLLQEAREQSNTEQDIDGVKTDANHSQKTAIDVTAFIPNSKNADQIDAEEADDYLKRILDEVEAEKRFENEPGNRDESSQGQPLDEDQAKDVEEPYFPSAPQDVLKSPPQSSQLGASGDDLQLRLASLSLPAVPKTAPSTKSSRASGFTDDDIDSWCIICLGDASIKCLGCSGDLYCSSCWTEGHKGESAGFEEKRHRAVRWRKSDGVAVV